MCILYIIRVTCPPLITHPKVLNLLRWIVSFFVGGITILFVPALCVIYMPARYWTKKRKTVPRYYLQREVRFWNKQALVDIFQWDFDTDKIYSRLFTGFSVTLCQCSASLHHRLWAWLQHLTHWLRCQGNVVCCVKTQTACLWRPQSG